MIFYYFEPIMYPRTGKVLNLLLCFKRQGFANARLSAIRKVGTFAAPNLIKINF